MRPAKEGSPFNPKDGGVVWRICRDHCGGRLYKYLATVCQKKGALKGRNWIDSFTTTPTFQPSGTAVKLSCSRVKDV